MRFLPTEEQRDFARSLDALLTAAETPATIRAWASGDPAPGRALWSRLAETGVFALAIPEPYEGVGPLPVELATAFVELGRHGVPGPVVETVAVGALLSELAGRGEGALTKRLLPGIATGETLATLAFPDWASPAPTPVPPRRRPPGAAPSWVVPTRSALRNACPQPGGGGEGGHRPAERLPTTGPRGEGGAPPGGAKVHNAGGLRVGTALRNGGAQQDALDADVADLVAVVRGDEVWSAASHGAVHPSADPARRLSRPTPDGELIAAGPAVRGAVEQAVRWAMLATAAQALGVGLTLLDRTVAYARQRTQFGTSIGSFQAVKHRLADTLLGLEFARPLLFGAALTFESADLAAAKVAAGEAAYAAARTALQIHGAVGYTEELDLSLWLRKARPLRDAWGTPSWCRAQVLSGSWS
ncbi:acyl-CoA dehydrogenase family protein [Streptomyces sp. NPDC003035]|uniref:acyl-CoA dehydrogenase family protein n=1 Tax=Streptomyces sp. NPDC003035 TaxID=3364676 RepID=UPI00367C8864